MNFPIFISCPKGFEYLLEDELKQLQFIPKRVSPQGVFGDATLELIYRICLWSRLASRVHLVLAEGPANHKDEVYQLCRHFSWDQLFSSNHTIAVEFHGESSIFRNSLYGAQLIKDGIVDFFTAKGLPRPSVSKQPDILIHAHLKNDQITLSFDLNGHSLHQRGYRLEAGIAPIKEHIAAAILIRARWPEWLKRNYSFYDPCCGAGTIVIEAAMMAGNIAPGLLREDQSFQYWSMHDAHLWAQMKEEAIAAKVVPEVRIMGSDKNKVLIERAKANAKRAGVEDWVEWEQLSVEEITSFDQQGLVVTNPPYGVRLGEEEELLSFYRALGRTLHTHFKGWQAAILTSSVNLARAIGLRSHKQYSIHNGPLSCKLYCIELSDSNQFFETQRPIKYTEGALMFANRLQKNLRHLQKWARRETIECYRIYDADLPEYAFAIDCYQQYVVVQEYAPPATVDPEKAEKRRLEVQQIIPEVLKVVKNHVIFKTRQQQKGHLQYEKRDQNELSCIVREGKAHLKVNLTNYLDTGLFLDHRPLRLHFANSIKPGMKFLNCFCYTGSASVHAAIAGAITVNVDLSNTYLQWAKENFQLNVLNTSRHQFIQADCLQWLHSARDEFDIIFLDPPSFSNSKKMEGILDIQRDHVDLIHHARRLLKPDGILYFSTNLKNFKLSPEFATQSTVQDITAFTLDEDFKNHKNIHRCYKIKK